MSAFKRTFSHSDPDADADADEDADLTLDAEGFAEDLERLEGGTMMRLRQAAERQAAEAAIEHLAGLPDRAVAPTPTALAALAV